MIWPLWIWEITPNSGGCVPDVKWIWRGARLGHKQHQKIDGQALMSPKEYKVNITPHHTSHVKIEEAEQDRRKIDSDGRSQSQHSKMWINERIWMWAKAREYSPTHLNHHLWLVGSVCNMCKLHLPGSIWSPCLSQLHVLLPRHVIINHWQWCQYRKILARLFYSIKLQQKIMQAILQPKTV